MKTRIGVLSLIGALLLGWTVMAAGQELPPSIRILLIVRCCLVVHEIVREHEIIEIIADIGAEVFLQPEKRTVEVEAVDEAVLVQQLTS